VAALCWSGQCLFFTVQCRGLLDVAEVCRRKSL